MSVTPQGTLVGIHGARPSLVVTGRLSFPKGWGFFVACFGNDRSMISLAGSQGLCVLGKAREGGDGRTSGGETPAQNLAPRLLAVAGQQGAGLAIAGIRSLKKSPHRPSIWRDMKCACTQHYL